MSSISNKSNKDVYAAFNKLGADAATNDAKMSAKVKEDVSALSQAVLQDTELSSDDKKSLSQQIANLLPIAGEAGHGAEWNADMQKLVHQLSSLQPSAAQANSAKDASKHAAGDKKASTTSNEQVFSAYDALNTLAGKNDPANNAKIHSLAKSLLTTVKHDASLSAAQKSSLAGKVADLVKIAGKTGHGAAWNTQMQGLVDELLKLPHNSASSAAGQSNTTSGKADATGGSQSKGATSEAPSTSKSDSASKTATTAKSSGTSKSPSTVVPKATSSTPALSDTTLFPSGKGPGLADIQQGKLNDCTIDAALSSMATSNPTAIADMFSKKANGTYDVTLFPRGVKTTVNVDPAKDLVAGGTVGADGKADWASMIEAAAVKVGFRLNDGNGAKPGDAMQLLTGTGGSAGLTSDFGTEANLEAGLKAELAAGRIVMAGTDTASIVNGTAIDANHAYAVLGVANGQVTVRNPWNNQANNGVLTMSVADYAKAFGGTYMQD